MASSNSCNKNICLILLIGIPGSGKTYLTKFLVDHFKDKVFNDSNKVYFSDCSVIPITYDMYISYKVDGDVIKDWKQKRKDVFSSIEEFILYSKGHKDKLTNKLFMNNISNYNTISSKPNIFIVIDDNMYYKSMRYEYFKLAKKYEISFCQIYLETTLDKALEYNKKRDKINIIPESVINKMYNVIEIPDSKVNNWERNSLIIPAFNNFKENNSLINNIYDVIISALKSPEKYLSNINEDSCRSECKRITDTNLIHQIDIKLRSLIGNYIKQLKPSNNEIKLVAESLNNNRSQLLKNIKAGVFNLPLNIIDNLRSNNDDNFVNNYFINLLTIDIQSSN